MTTMLTKSPGRKSDEATIEQLELARDQGKAYGAAVKEMTTDEAHGELAEAGDMLVGWAVEHAEGMYHLDRRRAALAEPAAMTRTRMSRSSSATVMTAASSPA